MLSACSEDLIDPTIIAGSIENTVYINTGFSSTTLGKNVFMSNPMVSFTTVVSGALPPIKFLVQCTHPATEDIRVELGKDGDAMVEGWNDLPGSVNIFNKAEYIIPKGETRSRDTVVLFVANTDMLALREGKFLYPFKILSVSSGAGISSGLSKGAYYANVTFSNNGAVTPPGTVMNPKPAGDTAWTAVAVRADDGTLTLTDVAYMLDDNTSTFQRTTTGDLSAEGILPLSIDIDLKKVYSDINGLRILTSGSGYRLTSMRVYIRKTETDTWESQGPMITYGNTSTNVVRFYEPVDARFIRCEVYTVQSLTSGLRIVDFNIYRDSWK